MTPFDSTKLIPFYFVIKLPPPCYERTIVSRDKQGKIIKSMTPRTNFVN